VRKTEVYEHARREGFTLVTKDADFGELAVLHGFPPKVVWIRRGIVPPRQLTGFCGAAAAIL
jgi:predicted nuclease of predicted toxin-antitoxin system